jgi:hypothetical protein
MRGWECLVDGVAGIDIQQSEQRSFTLTVNRTSGASETKSFDVPVMIYQGVFKSGQEYLPGDTVTWGGSLWHCDEQTRTSRVRQVRKAGPGCQAWPRREG